MRTPNHSTIALATGLALSPFATEAGVNGIAKGVQPVKSGERSGRYAELNLFYGLPGDVEGFSWGDFYAQGGYFGETNLERSVGKRFNAKVQLQHADNLLERAGLGFSVQTPTPKGTFLKLSAFPLWFTSEGVAKRTAEAAYFAQADLPFGFQLCSFGDINFAAKGGPRWGYGEIDIGKEVWDVKWSYNPALVSNGGVVPKLQHRVAASVDF